MITESAAVVNALLNNDHHFLAVRPADATPAEAPGFALPSATIDGFNFALNRAAPYWPGCSHWALIAGDQLIKRTGASNDPPELQSIRTPATLANFETRP